jgi:hypothetical protein
VVAAARPKTGDKSAIIEIGPNATNTTKLNLGKWLGQGIDPWVWATVSQLRALHESGTRSPATLVAYAENGMRSFFRFLIERKIGIEPSELNEEVVANYVDWLKSQPGANAQNQNVRYSQAKTMLVELQSRWIAGGTRQIFPKNPFPGIGATIIGERALSPGERARVAEALRKDIVAFHKGTFAADESHGLVVHLLALALRTGLNPSSMLELDRDCLKPHPLMPNMMLLQAFKRRGNGTHLKGLRYSESRASPASIPMDGVGLLSLILKRTEHLVADAPAHYKNRVWLHYKEGGLGSGEVTAIKADALTRKTRAFVQRHDLRADDGTPLRLNLSRLRKTMANRIFAISDGDLFVSAAIMGHQPQVAETHYLACTDEMRRNATFVGEALVETYRGTTTGEQGNSIPIKQIESTPVGRCKDSLNGEKAPKDGSHCMDFFSCFSCRSYAVVGSHSDLHRLFSFYWFLNGERQEARSQAWREHFMVLMTLIDAFTADKFDGAVVAKAKEAARLEPIAFWRSYQMGH